MAQSFILPLGKNLYKKEADMMIYAENYNWTCIVFTLHLFLLQKYRNWGKINKFIKCMGIFVILYNVRIFIIFFYY